MKTILIDKIYKISIAGWFILTIAFDFVYPGGDMLIVGLAGIFSTIIIYSIYLAGWEYNKK